MKKIISLLAVSVMILTLFTFAGCKKDKTPLKLGLGIYTAASATDATEDKAGEGQASVTVAAVLVDSKGKIVSAFVDCADSKVGYTHEGKAVAKDKFKTKYESGKDYNMVALGGATKEWYEQADAFCALIEGKTALEVKALVAENGKGTDALINAGCTISIADFVKAVDKAIGNASESEATKNDTLRIGVSTTQTTTDATEDRSGSNKVETTVFAAAVNENGKIAAASSDCVEVSFGFDASGKSLFNATKEVLTKKELGDGYGMKDPQYGSDKEWYEHAAIFDAACVGKSVKEIEALMGADNKGNPELQAAGCTISINGFVKAASKIK